MTSTLFPDDFKRNICERSISSSSVIFIALTVMKLDGAGVGGGTWGYGIHPKEARSR